MPDSFTSTRMVEPVGAVFTDTLTSVEDLLYHLPFRYEDRREVRTIVRLRPGEDATFEAKLVVELGVDLDTDFAVRSERKAFRSSVVVWLTVRVLAAARVRVPVPVVKVLPLKLAPVIAPVTARLTNVPTLVSDEPVTVAVNCWV